MRGGNGSSAFSCLVFCGIDKNDRSIPVYYCYGYMLSHPKMQQHPYRCSIKVRVLSQTQGSPKWVSPAFLVSEDEPAASWLCKAVCGAQRRHALLTGPRPPAAGGGCREGAGRKK